MRRWVFGLVAVAAAFWVWRSFSSASDVAAGTDSLERVRQADAPGTDRADGNVAGGQGSVSLTASGGRTPQSGDETGGKSAGAEASLLPGADLCAAVKRRDPAALASGYRRLLDLDGAARAAVKGALEQAAGSDLASMLAALGDGNAFLHSDAGREAARQVVKAAAADRTEAGLAAFTGVLERAMRGAIEPTDTEAKALVDEVYAAMQGTLNRTLFNPENLAGARTHKVAPGESLDRIAAAYRRQGTLLDALTIGLFNRVSDPTKLRADQILKIPVQPISTVIEKRSYLMAMYLGDKIFRLYWVGHGKDDRTPETTFTVTLKQEHPDWHFEGRVIPYGHPDNILGDYFVKFDHASFQGYGAHGTPHPETIGTMGSRGCIRMRDNDIREFFQVVPRGTPVHVRATQSAGSR